MTEVLSHTLWFCLGFIAVLWENESLGLTAADETEFDEEIERPSKKAQHECRIEAAAKKLAVHRRRKPPDEFHDPQRRLNSEKRGQAKYCVRNYADVFTDFLDTFESVFVFIKPRAEAQGLGFGHLRHRRNAVDPHPSLRATLS